MSHSSPDPEDEIIAQVARIIRAEGRLAAVRLLRRRLRGLGVVRARSYVLAVERGARPPYRITDGSRTGPAPESRPRTAIGVSAVQVHDAELGELPVLGG